MKAEIKSRFHVASEPDLFRAVHWAVETPARVRVVNTCVGPYGAIDQGRHGTTWFDVGDHLLYIGNMVVPVKSTEMAAIISKDQEDHTQ